MRDGAMARMVPTKRILNQLLDVRLESRGGFSPFLPYSRTSCSRRTVMVRLLGSFFLPRVCMGRGRKREDNSVWVRRQRQDKHFGARWVCRRAIVLL